VTHLLTSIFVLVCFPMVLGTKPRALNMLGKCCTTELHHHPLDSIFSRAEFKILMTQKGLRLLFLRHICLPMFIQALFTMARYGNFCWWMKRERKGSTYVCTRTPTLEYHSIFKKNEILPFETTWLKLKDNMLWEISQTDTYCMISLICEN
jgi:hypothetical protein